MPRRPLNETDLTPGTRVEIPCHYDLWMRGAKYGCIRRVTADQVHVKMDHPQVKRLARFPRADFLAYAMGV